ncbi:MAG: flagellar hook-associated protein FlgL [Planctomycetes bacterium]|nr:flagellar hook-associated protein FlgL [Planctomycetota bacterium]
MPLRPTHAAIYGLVQSNLERRLAEVIRAQEQAATGKRILRPSDDPVGASAAIDLRGEQSRIARWRETASVSRPYLDAANSALDSAQELVGQIRALTVQGLSATMNDEDRRGLAAQLESIKASLVDAANSSFDGKYLFGGTVSGTKPFHAGSGGRVAYRGNDGVQSVLLGLGVEVPINVPGSEVFAARDPRGLSISGLSGVRVGSAPSGGDGWVSIDVRHDATSGAPGSGITLAYGGSRDSILGPRAVVVDAEAGTIRLGNGPSIKLPAAGDPAGADLLLRDEHGAVVHLDVRGYDGTSSTTTLTGTGSIRAGSGDYVPIDTGATAFELVDPSSGAVLRVDTTNVVRSTQDVARFAGTIDLFTAIDGIIADLRNDQGLSLDEIQERMDARIAELVRNHEAVLSGMGRAGAAAQRLEATDERLSNQELTVAGRLSAVEDVDITDAILALTRAQQSLELAQSAGARLLQTSFLDYLR